MEYINVDPVYHLVHLDLDLDRRQQISPEMNFTCDGMITKWIIGADFNMSKIYNPELQIWRNIENRTYEKINGTMFETGISLFSNIYEFDNFSPIPVKSGDILGIFLPPRPQAKLRLRSQNANSPTHYYLTTESSNTKLIDVGQSYLISSYTNQPLVSVEFSK